MDITLNLILSLVIVFAILYAVFWAAGKFGSPLGQKIVGAVCLLVFVVYSLSRLGVLDSGLRI